MVVRKHLSYKHISIYFNKYKHFIHAVFIKPRKVIYKMSSHFISFQVILSWAVFYITSLLRIMGTLYKPLSHFYVLEVEINSVKKQVIGQRSCRTTTLIL